MTHVDVSHLTKPTLLCVPVIFQPARLVTTALWPLMAPVPSVRSTATPSGRGPPPASATRDTSAQKRTQRPCPAPVSTPSSNAYSTL